MIMKMIVVFILLMIGVVIHMIIESGDTKATMAITIMIMQIIPFVVLGYFIRCFIKGNQKDKMEDRIRKLTLEKLEREK